MPPSMCPSPSQRGGRGAVAPGTVHHHRPTPQFQQQRPAQPSSAAAKAAAAAKALHRSLQERAKTKQQQQHEEEKQRTLNDSNGQSSRPPSEQRNDVFRRSPDQEVTAEDQKARSGSILKKMMTTGQGYRVGPVAEDVKYEAEPSSAGGKNGEVAAASAGVPPTYPPGHPDAHYQHHPHMMYGHPNPYGHHPHYPYAHPHYQQNASNSTKSNEERATSPKNIDPNMQHHYYAQTYHQGHHYSAQPYYDGRNWQNPPPPPPPQFYNHYHRGTVPSSGFADGATTAEDGFFSKSSAAPSGSSLEEQSVSNNARGSTRHVIGSHTSIHVPRAPLERHEKSGPSPEKECLPSSSSTARNEAIFRYGDDSEGRRDLLQSTEILLSLSKSFDHGDGTKHNHHTRGSAKKAPKPKKKTKKKKATKKEGDSVVSTPGKHTAGERPKSPDDPPRIHHFHKLSNVRTFEVSYVYMIANII